jgi:hypothetical protein
MSSIFGDFVKRTPAIVEDKKFGLKVRLEAQRCITYTKLALSAQDALSKEQARVSSADQPAFGVDLAAQLAPDLQKCEQFLCNLMQNAYTRYLGATDTADLTDKQDVERIPEDQREELLRAFKEAKDKLQSYVADLDLLLAKQQPQQLPVVNKPQPKEQPAIFIPSAQELERKLSQEYSGSGIRVGRAPESAIAQATGAFGVAPQASSALPTKRDSDKGDTAAAAAAAAPASSRWQLATLSPRDLSAAVQLTYNIAAMQAATNPQPPAVKKLPLNMPAALGRGFSAPMAARGARAMSAGTKPTTGTKAPMQGFRPLPRPVAPVVGASSSRGSAVGQAPSVGQVTLSSSIPSTQTLSPAISTSSSQYERLKEPLSSAGRSQQQQMYQEQQQFYPQQQFQPQLQQQQQQLRRQGPIRLLSNNPLDCHVQKICSISLSPFAIQVKPQATKPAVELLQQLQAMQNQDKAWSCRLTWMVEVAKGLEVMHKHNVVHGCVTAGVWGSWYQRVSKG